jgi:MFS family permease
MKAESKIITVSALGGILEYYDFVLFILFGQILGKVFFIESESTFLSTLSIYTIFASGYLVRPFGGIILAHFGDKFGRKKVFSLTIMLMSIPTLAIGLLPSYAQIGSLSTLLLLLLRLCQGLAVGGEIPSAIAFVFEHINKKRRCTGIAFLIGGLIGGILLGSVTGNLLIDALPHDIIYSWGWRVPFILGGSLCVVGVYLRKKLTETPQFLNIEKNKQILKIPIRSVMHDYKIKLFQASVISSIIAVFVTVFYMYLPIHIMQYLHYSLEESFALNTTGLILFVLCIVFFGLLVDKYQWDIKKVFGIGLIFILILSMQIFTVLSSRNFMHIFLMYVVLALGMGACFSTFSVILAELFPVNVRTTGISTAYNISFAVFGGLAPVTCELLIKIMGSVFAPIYFIITMIVIGLFTIPTIKFNN